MAPLPTTNTARLVADCRWRERPYDVLFRFSSSTSIATASAAVDDFFSAIFSNFFNDWAFLGTGAWYPEGSTISLPVPDMTPVIGTAGASPSDMPDAVQFEFLGRDTNGRRAAWYLPGVNEAATRNQRLNRASFPRIDDIYTAFENLRDAGLRTIGGNAPLFKSYANYVVNDYLTRQARRG